MKVRLRVEWLTIVLTPIRPDVPSPSRRLCRAKGVLLGRSALVSADPAAGRLVRPYLSRKPR
ncbi:MAG: hypothetical protein EOR73_02590 [Mesorhizobium sp.]|nr:MAG: hypothetical protein EOR73_02590 [Mesorhizobium sp.]